MRTNKSEKAIHAAKGMLMHRFRCKKGFTLVEVSIVLIILGIILTTIIKGGEVLRAGKIKNLLLTQNDLHQAVLAYREKFGYLPGDDPMAVTHVGATTNGNGNGIVVENTERYLVFQHLVNAGLITGTYDGNTPMVSNFSNDISIMNVDFATVCPSGTPAPPCPLDPGTDAKPGTTAVVYKNLPYDVAQALEVALDGSDGTDRTGSVRGSKNYTSANSPVPFTYSALYPVAP